MPTLTEAQVIEAFHLAFLQVLQSKLDQARYVLKGGANLRYFLGSQRYSQDIDLDLIDAETWIIEKKVDEVIRSKALEIILRSHEITIQLNKGKHTGTTQKWSPELHAPGHSRGINTKIEFSNRNGDDRYLLEAVPRRIVEPYALQPPRLQHYEADAATEQKIVTLASRSATQARDVFDLDLLFRSHGFDISSVPQDTRDLAAERALELSFDVFKTQVSPFLEPEISEVYDRSAWEQMQLFVSEKLEGRDETN